MVSNPVCTCGRIFTSRKYKRRFWKLRRTSYLLYACDFCGNRRKTYIGGTANTAA